jgi:hypothetical protein
MIKARMRAIEEMGIGLVKGPIFPSQSYEEYLRGQVG